MSDIDIRIAVLESIQGTVKEYLEKDEAIKDLILTKVTMIETTLQPMVSKVDELDTRVDVVEKELIRSGTLLKVIAGVLTSAGLGAGVFQYLF